MISRNTFALPLMVAGLIFNTAMAIDTITPTDAGPVEGTVENKQTHVIVFKGIPYAAPPVGPNRWRDPQLVTPWQGVRPCKEFGRCCPQSDVLERMYALSYHP